MAKFHGQIGYALVTETSPGVFEDVISEVTYYGDVVRNNRKLREGDQVNDDILVQNLVSVLADAYAVKHIHNMRYVVWQDTRWKVVDVEVQRPRLVLRLGGVYNGDTP